MNTKVDTRAHYRTRWYHRRPAYWLRKDPVRAPGHREAPEVVRFDVEPGVAPSPEPPVRIFLGTEPMQARAERVFLWSVKERRDRTRVYEVHLMKDLAGFDRTGWTTGFTNYRYAIPALAGNAGRAIYNDVDQIYLADPAEMFDLDMGRAGVLCVDEGETSVALIDCAAMAERWRIADARAEPKRRRFLDAMVGAFGPLPGEWNARDDEYAASRSKCFHFTTLRMQPWRPFPEQLRYQDHRDGEAWFALERAADAARFTAFSRLRPSAGFAERLAALAGAAAPADAWSDADIRRLVSETGATTLIDVSLDSDSRSFPGVTVARAPAPFAAPLAGRAGGVIASGALERLPEDDVSWALDELFAAASRFVRVAVSVGRPELAGAAGALEAGWWRLQLELAAARNPGRLWSLAVADAVGRATQTRSNPSSRARAA